MSYCLNRVCPKPHNPEAARFCQTCGARLLLGDRYRAIERLGDEAGSTLLGGDLAAGDCVIKQYAVGNRLPAFRQEVARLDLLGEHPQIPNLLAYFERDSQQYLIQERVEGRSLLAELQDTGSFSEAQLRQMLQAVLPLLQFLHDRQVIHRDIKPANLRRQADGQLMLVDFGAAKHATRSALAKTGTVLGSAEYAAPEQLVGKAIPASDLYSLGVTCIHLLTGLPPFDLYRDGTWFWRSVTSGVSEPLAQAIDRLLQTSASQRYPSAATVMQALNLSAIGQTIVQSAAASMPPQIWNCAHALTAATPIAALTSQGDRLAAGSSNGTLYQWDLPGLQPRSPLKAHHQPITAIALTDDLLISSSLDLTICLWNRATEQVRHQLTAHTAPVTAIALSSDQRQLVSGSRDRTLKLWDLATGQLLHSFTCPDPISAVAWNGSIIASGDASGNIAIWHSDTRELLRTLMPHQAAVQAVAIRGDRLISSSWDLTLQIRNLHTGGLRHSLTGHLLPVVAIACQDNQIASGSHDSTIRVWRDGQLQAVLEGHQASVSALTFTAIGLVSGSQDCTVRVWQPVESL